MIDQNDTMPLLTLKQFRMDTLQFDKNAEVAVAVHGLGIVIPVGYLTQAVCAGDKKYVLAVVSEASLRNALSYLDEQNTETAKEIQ